MGELSPKVTERARTLTKKSRRSDSIALPKRQLIAAWRLSGDGLALSVNASHCHLSQRERLWHTVKPRLFARGSPTRSNGDDRRQWRKQGGAVGAAASRMRAAAKQTLGAATRAVSPKVTERALVNFLHSA